MFPQIPSNGEIVEFPNPIFPGDIIPYTCTGGLGLIGNRNNTCDDNGMFGPAPMCEFGKLYVTVCSMFNSNTLQAF